MKAKIGIINYYIFWNLLMIGKGLGFTGNSRELRSIAYIAMTFLIIKIIYTSWKREELQWSIFLVSYGLINWILSQYTGVFLTILAIIGSKGVSRYKLFKMALYVRGTLFVYMLFSALLGFRDMEVSYRWIDRTQIIKRYSFGYGHPNASHYAFFTLILLFILLRIEKLKFIHYAIFIGFNIFVYKYTNSRTGLLMVFFLLTLMMLENIGLILIIKINITKNIYIIMTSISLAIVYLYDDIAVLHFYGTLSSRFSTANNLVNRYSINLFGIPNIETDFGYIAILYQSGIIAILIFVIGSTILLKKAIEQNNIKVMACLIIYGIYTMSESYSVSILMNVMLLYFSDFIFKNEIQEQELTKLKHSNLRFYF